MARQLYTEAGDKKADAKLLKKLTPAQKAAFEKVDKKHKKVKYQDEDTKIDRKIIAKVKKQTKKK
jgi:hypothetical protein